MQHKKTYSVALVSAQTIQKIRTGPCWKSGGGGKMRRKRTYVSVPLEMLVDEPEGNDGGHDSEAAGYKPPSIMSYEV